MDKKIVVFGGTFNPIHIGHEEIIKEISRFDDVDKVLLIPTKIPPHKDTDFLASELHRINMCNIIASRYNNVEVSDIEIKRQGRSYTIDTINLLKKVYPTHKIAITIGADMLTTFHLWKDYEKLLSEVSVFAFGRTTVSNSNFLTAVDKLINLGADIRVINKEISDVSSTEIRNSLKANFKLLDNEIYNYILDNNVYGV